MLRYFQLISGYFYGKAKRMSKKCAYKTRNWTYLDVVSVKKCQKINKLSEKLSESAPGSQAFLGTWSKAQHQVELMLTSAKSTKHWQKNGQRINCPGGCRYSMCIATILADKN